MNDIDRSNNRRTSTSPVKVNLTPPPNLVVESVSIPSSTFSGKHLDVERLMNENIERSSWDLDIGLLGGILYDNSPWFAPGCKLQVVLAATTLNVPSKSPLPKNMKQYLAMDKCFVNNKYTKQINCKPRM